MSGLQTLVRNNMEVIMQNNFKDIAATILALAVVATSPALAEGSKGVISTVEQDGTITRSIKVPYGDLNLISSQGAKSLQARVRRAAREVCEYQGDSLNDRRGWLCYRKAMGEGDRNVQLAIVKKQGGQKLASRESGAPSEGSAR
jgi:UrcA family protein